MTKKHAWRREWLVAIPLVLTAAACGEDGGGLSQPEANATEGQTATTFISQSLIPFTPDITPTEILGIWNYWVYWEIPDASPPECQDPEGCGQGGPGGGGGGPGGSTIMIDLRNPEEASEAVCPSQHPDGTLNRACLKDFENDDLNKVMDAIESITDTIPLCLEAKAILQEAMQGFGDNYFLHAGDRTIADDPTKTHDLQTASLFDASSGKRAWVIHADEDWLATASQHDIAAFLVHETWHTNHSTGSHPENDNTYPYTSWPFNQQDTCAP